MRLAFISLSLSSIFAFVYVPIAAFLLLAETIIINNIKINCNKIIHLLFAFNTEISGSLVFCYYTISIALAEMMKWNCAQWMFGAKLYAIRC